MRRWLLIPLVLITFAALAKEKPIAKELLEAKTVKVMVLPGNFEHVGNYSPTPFDRDAVNDVKDALRKWGRWALVGDREPSDIVVLVRSAARAVTYSTSTRGGTVTKIGGSGIGERSSPATGPSEQYPHGGGSMIEHPTPPKDDIIAIFTAKEAKSAVYVAGGRISHAKPLWLLNESGILRSTSVPGIAELRRDVENAEVANEKVQ